MKVPLYLVNQIKRQVP